MSFVSEEHLDPICLPCNYMFIQAVSVNRECTRSVGALREPIGQWGDQQK